jgi:ferredoxin-type protein NapH
LTEAKGAAFRVKRLVWRIETARKITQFLSIILFNAGLFGVGPWAILLPVMYTLGIQQKTVGDAFAMLQWMLHDLVFPWLPLASFLLVAVFLGRALCGWVCPFGLVQDLLGYVKRKRMELSIRTHDLLVNVKYVILAITLLISVTLAISLATGVGQGYKAALGALAPAPFNALSPGDTLFAVLPTMVYAASNTSLDALAAGILVVRPLLWARLAIMVTILVLAVYIPRSWCKYLCPHGAALAFLNRFSFLGLKRDPLRCTKAGCRTCVEVCPMKVPILDLPWEKFTDPECTYCLKCADACTTKAIKPKFP